MSKLIYLQEPIAFNKKLAEELKELPEFKAPEWMSFVKSSSAKQRPPQDDDFWYMRAASILRQLYLRGVVGVNRLRTKYGSRKHRAVRPDRFRKSGGKIIRVILQQAEKAGLTEKLAFDGQFGRRLTMQGRKFLDSIKTNPEKK
jgi:small subunit ribosomal protein S19e